MSKLQTKLRAAAMLHGQGRTPVDASLASVLADIVPDAERLALALDALELLNACSWLDDGPCDSEELLVAKRRARHALGLEGEWQA